MFENDNIIQSVTLEEAEITTYLVDDLLKLLPNSICAEQIEEYLATNHLELGINGNLTKKSYELALDFFQVKKETLLVKEKLSYESSDGRVKVYQQDAITFLSQLPDASVDMIITDPAYSGMNQKLKLGKGKIIGKYSEKGDGAKWFDEFHDTEENYTLFLKECFRVLKKDSHIYIMFDSYSLLSLAPLLRTIFEVKNVVVWDKMNIGLGHYFRRRHEFIVFASKGKRPLNAKNIPDIWRIKRVTQFKYPTQKPTEVFEMMLKSSAKKDFVVCDPFLGSGSSAIASIKNNCHFLGCDIAQSSIETASERIKIFLETGKDKTQPNRLVEDETMLNILKNG